MCDKSYLGQCFPAPDIIINFLCVSLCRCIIQKIYDDQPAHGSAILFQRAYSNSTTCALYTVVALPEFYFVCGVAEIKNKMDASCPERLFSNAL